MESEKGLLVYRLCRCACVCAYANKGGKEKERMCHFPRRSWLLLQPQRAARVHADEGEREGRRGRKLRWKGIGSSGSSRELHAESESAAAARERQEGKSRKETMKD